MTKQRLGQIRCPRRRLHIYDGSLGGEPVHVFLQAQVKLRHLPGGFPAHIAVVPGLIDNACDLAFGVGIAQDKTVFPAVLDQPLLDQGVLLPLVQNLIGGVYNVQGQARLVLTGARYGYHSSSLRDGVFV